MVRNTILAQYPNPEENTNFVPFTLPFKGYTATQQAEAILKVVGKQISLGKKMVGITYSANDLQIKPIHDAYESGGNGISKISGANQASVMMEVERLLETPEYIKFKKKFRILPITTTYYSSYSGSSADVEREKIEMLVNDFEYIDNFIKDGGLVLGWQNPQSKKNGRYAIGGGITKLPPAIDEAIQSALKGYEKGEKEQAKNIKERLVKS